LSVAAEIRSRLAALEPESLELIDESAQHAGHAGAAPGGETHWRLSIVSPRFHGQPTVARHRMIYQALGPLMQHPIHALVITARAPAEQKGSP
jgi:BolA protein